MHTVCILLVVATVIWIIFEVVRAYIHSSSK
jgi:hypothetical protein